MASLAHERLRRRREGGALIDGLPDTPKDQRSKRVEPGSWLKIYTCTRQGIFQNTLEASRRRRNQSFLVHAGFKFENSPVPCSLLPLASPLRTIIVICFGLRILSSFTHSAPSPRRRFHFDPLNQERKMRSSCGKRGGRRRRRGGRGVRLKTRMEVTNAEAELDGDRKGFVVPCKSPPLSPLRPLRPLRPPLQTNERTPPTCTGKP